MDGYNNSDELSPDMTFVFFTFYFLSFFFPFCFLLYLYYKLEKE